MKGKTMGDNPYHTTLLAFMDACKRAELCAVEAYVVHSMSGGTIDQDTAQDMRSLAEVTKALHAYCDNL